MRSASRRWITSRHGSRDDSDPRYGSACSARGCAAVYERTDGIPLHIEELLGALSDDARANGLAIREARVPETIEDAVLSRLSHRTPEAQAVRASRGDRRPLLRARGPGRDHGPPARGDRRPDPGVDRSIRVRPAAVAWSDRLPPSTHPRRDLSKRLGRRPPALSRAGRRVRGTAGGAIGDPFVPSLREGRAWSAGLRNGPSPGPATRLGCLPIAKRSSSTGGPSDTSRRDLTPPSGRPSSRRTPTKRWRSSTTTSPTRRPIGRRALR